MELVPGHQPSTGDDDAEGTAVLPEVAVRHLRASYDKAVFTDVTFSAASGAVTVVAGPSGTGKTLLVSLLLGRQAADRGEIAVGGRPVVGASPSQLADIHARTAFLFSGLDAGAKGRRRRHPRSVDAPDDGVDVRRTIRDNIEGRAASPERARQLLADFELTDVADLRAGGLDVGLRRRVALACAFAADPTLVLLDDPVAALGPSERDAVVAGLLRARSSSPVGPPTTVLTCWDLTTARALGDDFVTLLSGRVGVQRPAVDALRFITDDRDLAVHFAVGGAADRSESATASLTEYKSLAGLFRYDQRAGLILLTLVGVTCLIMIFVLLVITGTI